MRHMLTSLLAGVVFSGAFGVDLYEVDTHRFVMHAARGLTQAGAKAIRDDVPFSHPGFYGVITASPSAGRAFRRSQ
jgi:hypothetical protein